MNSKRVYLDCAASAPLRSEVADAMRAAARDANFNPSSLHAEGRRAAAVLDAARERVAAFVGAAREEITFTSSGTEADNLAILGVVRAAGRGAHVVTAAFEHHAVLHTVERLEAEGYETTVLPVTSDGFVEVGAFTDALRPQTVLASVMHANNEIGTVQPLAELTKAARERGIAFHTDAVASACWLPLDVAALGVDLLSLSAHKCGGPKGVGALYARRGIALAPLLQGGAQEFGRRAGTQGVESIVGMAAALQLAARDRERQSRRIAGLRDRLESGIVAAIPEVRINGRGPRLPNVLNVSFRGLDSAALLIALDLAGIAVSAGSACASGSPEASHVIAALGGEPSWQAGAIRFSLGPTTAAEEIERVLELLPTIIADLRSASGSVSPRPVGPAGGWVD